MKELYSAEEVRQLDNAAINKSSITGITLMDRAGAFAFDVLKQKWKQARSLVIFCGTGNNGGDGYVLARLALKNNYNVLVYQVGDVSKIKGDARVAYDSAVSKGVICKAWNESERIENNVDLIVDALLGIGCNSNLDDEFLKAVQYINECKKTVLSIDIPTGLNANTGEVLGDAVYSDVTVTFVGNKKGMFTGKARDYCGEILFSSLDIPNEIYHQVKHDAIKIDFDYLEDKLPIRKSTTNKWNCGHVFVIGGAPSMGGAVRMAGEAALRIGSGLVSIITHEKHAEYISSSRPELMCIGTDGSNIEELLNKAIDKKAVILLGPGLGRSEWSKKIFNATIKANLPMVIDADGLNLLVESKNIIENCILTPHSKEASRLLNINVDDIEKDRFKSLNLLQEKFNSTIVLKGAGTLVSYYDKIGICCSGNASMATAGMGDILAGIIAGLLAQGLNNSDSAAIGVCIHSEIAGIISNKGKNGIIATDLLPELSKYVRAQ